MALVLVAACLAPLPPLSAELAVLTNGSVLKVDGHELENGAMRLDLPNGGSLILPILRIERIVDDEVPPEPEPLPEPPGFDLGFLGQRIDKSSYADLIVAAAQRHELNPQLLQAMMRAESAFDARAVSHKGGARRAPAHAGDRRALRSGHRRAVRSGAQHRGGVALPGLPA